MFPARLPLAIAARRSSGLGALLAVVVAAPEAARADDRTVPAEPLEVIVRRSREPDTFTSTRAAATITAAEIRDASPGSLADAARGSAGVTVQQTTPGQGTIYVRGLAGREVLTAIDGVRLNTAIFRSPNNAATTLVDPLSLRAIEVIRGPSSVLHASDALGGVLWLTTAMPAYTDGVPASRVSTFESVTSNPVGSSSRVAASYSTHAWAAHAGVTYQVFGDVRPGEGERTPDPASYAGLEKNVGDTYAPTLRDVQVGTGFQRVAADAVVRTRLGATSEAIVRAQLSRRPELVRYDEITPRFGGDAPSRAESLLGPLQRTMTSATFVHRPRGGLYESGLVMFAWQRLSERLHRRSMREVCVTGEDDCTTRLRLLPAASAVREDTRSDALSVRGEARFLGESRNTSGTVGFELVHDIVTSRSDSGPPRYPSGSAMTQGGVFTQIEARIVPSLRVHGGGRVSGFYVDIPARSDGPAVASTLVDVAAGAGIGWDAAPGLAWVANVGRGVRSPNIEDFGALGSRAGGRFQIPNSDLRPEHTRSVDTGLKVRRGPLRVQTFVFYSTYEDAIGVRDATVDGASRAPDGARYVRSENVSALHFYGVESDGRLGWDDGPGMYVRQVATTFTEDTRPGVSAAERVATPAQFVLGAYWQLTPRVRVESFALVRDAQRRVTNAGDNRIPPGGTPGSTSLHGRMRWTVTPELTARLALDNVTDALILEHGSGFWSAGFSTTASLEAKLLP